MKSTIRFRTVVSLAALLALGVNCALAAPYVPDPKDVTQPGDPIVISDANGGSAPGEEVPFSIDNNLHATQMYNNFGNFVTGAGTGLEVDASHDTRVVTQLRVFTSNGDPSNDPTSYQLFGGPAIGNTPTLISAGSLFLPAGRNMDNTTDFSYTENFPNLLGPFDAYRVVFPTTNGGASLMIGEIELVPEPSSMALIALAGLGLFTIRRRK